MMKSIWMVGISLLAAGSIRGEGVATSLNFASAGKYLDTSARVVTTPQSYKGATFDIVYTLGAIGGANAFVYSTGSVLGVGSDSDIASNYNTIEGNDQEGVSFTGLAIKNFEANDSGLEVGDIRGLTFTGLALSNCQNKQDGINVSFINFGHSSVSVDLYEVETAEPDLDLIQLSNYPGLATNLYFKTDNARLQNRFSATGISVAYSVVPKPAMIGLLGVGAMLMLMVRKADDDE